MRYYYSKINNNCDVVSIIDSSDELEYILKKYECEMSPAKILDLCYYGTYTVDRDFNTTEDIYTIIVDMSVSNMITNSHINFLRIETIKDLL